MIHATCTKNYVKLKCDHFVTVFRLGKTARKRCGYREYRKVNSKEEQVK